MTRKLTLLSSEKMLWRRKRRVLSDYWVNWNPNMFGMTSEQWEKSCLLWTAAVFRYGFLVPSIPLFIFGLVFNPIALYYFATSRNFYRTTYSYYFSAIAVVDLLRLISWLLFIYLDYIIFIFEFHWYECSAQVFCESVTASMSAWLTVAMTVERCLVTFRPLQTINETRGRRTCLVILIVTLSSLAMNSVLLQPNFYQERSVVTICRLNKCQKTSFSSYLSALNKSRDVFADQKCHHWQRNSSSFSDSITLSRDCSPTFESVFSCFLLHEFVTHFNQINFHLEFTRSNLNRSFVFMD
jgi:hypothetical protein